MELEEISEYMSQRLDILYLLKNSLNYEVSCKKLSEHYLFHKAASRISELRAEGHDIRYIPSKTGEVMEAKYKLVVPIKGQQQMDLGV